MSRPIATIATHADLVAAIKARLAELQLPYLGADAVAGLASGHTGKLLCGLKGFGAISLFALLDMMGCSLVLVEDEAKTARAREAAKRLHVEPRRGKLARRPRQQPDEAQPAA